MNGSTSRLLRPSPASDHKDNVCRIVVLGQPGVGKTALTVRFLTKRFIGEYCPTLESIYRYMYTSTDDDDIRLDILDTAGQLSAEWKESYALWGDCFIFVYSVTDFTSFDEIHRLRRLVESTKRSSSLCCAVVGNKNDLVYDRQVTVSQGQDLATDIGCRFYELSACDWNQYSQIYNLFTELPASWRRSRILRDGRQRKSSSGTKFKQAIQKVISGRSFADCASVSTFTLCGTGSKVGGQCPDAWITTTGCGVSPLTPAKMDDRASLRQRSSHSHLVIDHKVGALCGVVIYSPVKE